MEHARVSMLNDGCGKPPGWAGYQPSLQLSQLLAFAPQQGCLDSRHIHLGLGRQTTGDGIKAVRLTTLQQVLDSALASVIRSQGQTPVMEPPMQILQILR